MRIDIPGYEGLYTIDYTLNAIYKGNRKLKCYRKKWGHLQIGLTKNKIRKTYGLHQIVMLIKEGPCPEGMEVCHNDGDPANNFPENLRYDTRSSNQKDKYKHGYIGFFSKSNPNIGKGANNRNSKIVYQYSIDGSFIKSFPGVREASRDTGIPHINISQCARGMRKRAGKYMWNYFYFDFLKV